MFKFWRQFRAWRWQMWKNRLTERPAMFFARRVPKLIRKWVVVYAFADASAANPDKQPDELGYSLVSRAMK